MNGPTVTASVATAPTETSPAAKPGDDFQIDADADFDYRASETTWRERVADAHPPALAKVLGVQERAEATAALATLPPPPAPLTVKVFDETGGQVTEYEVPVDGYVVVTNGRCKVAATYERPDRGCHLLTVTGVALRDAEVAR